MSISSNYKRRIVTAPPVKKIIRRSKQTFLPGFDGFSLYEVWQPFLQQLRTTSLMERAAAISFNIVMAIPPTLIFIFTLIPYLPISDQFINELFSLIRTVVPGRQNNEVIIAFLHDFLTQPRNELLSFGLLLSMIFSSNAVMASAASGVKSSLRQRDLIVGSKRPGACATSMNNVFAGGSSSILRSAFAAEASRSSAASITIARQGLSDGVEPSN